MKKTLLLFVLTFILKAPLIAQTNTYENSGKSTQAWMDIRVRHAKKGMKEKVEMPFVVRSTGWGCICPDYYIGISPLVAEGPWVFPLTPDNFPVSDSVGHSLIVKGYFTGKNRELDLRTNKDDPAEWLFKMPEFKIISWKENKQGYEAPPPRVVTK